MEFTLTTPALLFPAISLLMLAYTNRFLAIATIIRSLHANYKDRPDPFILQEIASLRYRVRLIRDTQALGVTSFLLCVISMCALLARIAWVGEVLFAISLILLTLSLAVSAREIQLSIQALDLHLRDIEVSRPYHFVE